MIASRIYVRNKTQLIHAISALDYIDGQHVVVNERRDGSATRFIITPKGNGRSREQFELFLRQWRRNVERSVAHVWQ